MGCTFLAAAVADVAGRQRLVRLGVVGWTAGCVWFSASGEGGAAGVGVYTGSAVVVEL